MVKNFIDIRNASRKSFCTIVPNGKGWNAYFVWPDGRRTPLYNFSTVEKALEGTFDFSTLEEAMQEAIEFFESLENL